MSIYTGDQQSTTSVVLNGTQANATPAQIKVMAAAAAAPMGMTAVQFTGAFAIHHAASGGTHSYRKGQVALVDAATRAVLVSANAPVVFL